MDIRALVANQDVSLTRSEKEIVEQILGNLEEAAMLPAAELAAKVGMHESTAVRLVQKLGFSGYREFRKELQKVVLDEVDSSERIQRRLSRSKKLADLVSDEIQALDEMVACVPQELLYQAAERIIQARHIYLFARGHATTLIELMDRRLRRMGFHTVDLRYEGRDLAEHVVTLSSQDIVLAVVLRHVEPGLNPLIRHAHEVMAPVIVISDTVGPLLRPHPEILLWASRGIKGEFLTHVVPLTICNALVLTIAELDESRTFQSLDKVTQLIQRYT